MLCLWIIFFEHLNHFREREDLGGVLSALRIRIPGARQKKMICSLTLALFLLHLFFFFNFVSCEHNHLRHSKGDVDLWPLRLNGSACRMDGKAFFVYDNIRHLFLDRYTMISYSYWEPEACSQGAAAMEVGSSIQTRWRSNHPNEIILEIQKEHPEKCNIIDQEVPRLGGFMNSALHYRGQPHFDWIVRIALKGRANHLINDAGE